MHQVLQQLLKFQSDRNWKQFNTPQNLAKSLVLEAAEVLEIFQWKEGSELSEEEKAALADELADVYNWVILLSHDLGIDIEAEALKKIEKNAKKYPVEEFAEKKAAPRIRQLR
jgi:NTP pyrophosphatase (non-canonical NTP hydrolase)